MMGVLLFWRGIAHKQSYVELAESLKPELIESRSEPTRQPRHSSSLSSTKPNYDAPIPPSEHI
ncbi:hypothetical protein ACF3MZ_08125 [Paenibacillaceae bacterium WGS1546]|uniref:hypothetical protein n=1 Tax=Cohnella sp. WGS1546 TaxID=3366810 RepID=UPI00372D3C60